VFDDLFVSRDSTHQFIIEKSILRVVGLRSNPSRPTVIEGLLYRWWRWQITL